MNLTPFTRKIEIDAGFKGFYKIGNEKCTVTVNDFGIQIVFDTRTGIPSQVGVLRKLFKPISGMGKARVYADKMPQLTFQQALLEGFVLTGEVIFE